MQRPSARLLAAAVTYVSLTGLATTLAAPADAAVRVGSDGRHHVGFRLDGRALTVTLTGGSALAGLPRVLTFACGNPTAGVAGVAHRDATWPRGRQALTVRLPRDVSATATFCLLEDARGGDLASARLRGA